MELQKSVRGAGVGDGVGGSIFLCGLHLSDLLTGATGARGSKRFPST